MRGRAPLVMLVTLACSSAPEPVAPPPPVAPAPGPFRVVEPPSGPGEAARYPVARARVFALADTQLHHMYGKRTFAQSPFADRYHGIEVAIRPAALDDGADLLLEEFLAERRARYPGHTLVYLGDAADLSCTQEYERFFAIMTAAGEERFAMVTSNHDGFYVGNYTQKADVDGKLEYTDMPEDWARACSEPESFDDHRLTKGRAVAWLAKILPDAPAWATSVATGEVTDPSGYKSAWLAFARPLGGGDEDAPPAWGLYLDTVDYRDFALSKSKGAGVAGSVSQAQLTALDKAMFEAQVAAGDQRIAWLLAGHHTLAELESKARERVYRFLDQRPEILAYMSAHTHYADERRHQLPSGRRFPEFVTGSTTDFGGPGAPQSARLVEIRFDPATGKSGVVTSRVELDPAALCGEIDALATSDPLGYTSYRFARDDVPDVPTGTWDQFWAWLEDSELGPYRVAQTAGAMFVENKLVRSLAALHRDAPAGSFDDAVRARLAALVESRVPGEPERSRPLTPYDEWIDPVLSRDVPPLARELHTFGQNRELFAGARDARTASAGRRRWFACHAARAAEAEASRRRRDGNVLLIR